MSPGPGWMSGPFAFVGKMLREFEKSVADFIESKELFGSAEKVLLAVSGGADSIALLYAVFALKSEGIFDGEILCAHVNHQLRGSQADADEDFVIAEAAKLGASVITKRIDVKSFAHKNKLSIETAGRKLRLECLADIAKSKGCGVVATGHHADDNAETIVQRLARGTGFRGLCGIWPVRTFDDNIRFARPLLYVRREKIIEYLKSRGLKWRTDPTNQDCGYRRNFIRHRLIPALQQECNHPVAEQLSDLSQRVCKFYSLVCGSVDKVWPTLAKCCEESIKLAVKKFSQQVPAVQVELIRRSLTAIGSGERNLTQGHYERILQLAKQNVSGKKIELPGGFVVLREYEKLIFTREKKRIVPAEQIPESVTLEIPGQTRFGNYLVEAEVSEANPERFENFKAKKDGNSEWFDFDKLKLPLEVRFRKTGDRFVPLGQSEEKKVGKFLTDARVPHSLREKTLIIADAEKIIWVWPIRMSQQARVTGETKNILIIRLEEV